MNTQIEDLKTKGFVVVSYPPELRAAVNKTAELWKEFCALEDDIKKGLPYSNNADGVGYELKDGSGEKGDRKENFDVSIAGQKWLETHITEIHDPVVLEFIQHAISLVPLLKPLVFDFALQVEKTYGLENFLQEVEEGEDVFFVRFIHNFEGGEVQKEITVSHCDQGGCAPHLFASSLGLQYLPYDASLPAHDEDWKDFPVSDEETIIMSAMQMQLRSQGELRALCHRVVATPETAQIGRYSAVCFVQFRKTPKYDKELNGRLQMKKPGFNYSMPHEEFEKLFKK